MLTRQFPLSPLHRSKSRSSARTRTNVAECSRRRPSVAIEWLARTLFSTRRATIVLTDLKGVYMSDRENGNHGPNGFSVSIVPAPFVASELGVYRERTIGIPARRTVHRLQ